MADINEEWYNFGATILRTTKQLPSVAQDEAGITPATVTASVRVWQAGVNCPDGHVFADYSTVQATSLNPTTREDKKEMHKDDKANAKTLYGNAENEWHEGVRGDFNKVPDTDYKNRKVYINMRWNFEDQLEEIKKDKERSSPRINKVDVGKRPKWLDKAYGKKGR